MRQVGAQLRPIRALIEERGLDPHRARLAFGLVVIVVTAAMDGTSELNPTRAGARMLAEAAALRDLLDGLAG